MCTRTPSGAHPIFVVSRLTLPFVVFFVFFKLAAQSPDPLADAFARMDKVAPQFKAVTADIKRDVYTAVIDDHEKDMGTIKASRDKSHGTRMLIEFTSPDVKTIALDGTSASVYTPTLKTVQVVDIKKGLVDQFLLLGFGASSADLKENYDVTFVGTEKPASETAWHLQLIPKSKETSGLPVQEKLFTSSGGDYQLCVYSNVILNPSLPDSKLKLNYPKGVTVEHPRL
jgi:outer membrane lipoprotein-sorting protein